MNEEMVDTTELRKDCIPEKDGYVLAGGDYGVIVRRAKTDAWLDVGSRMTIFGSKS